MTSSNEIPPKETPKAKKTPKSAQRSQRGFILVIIVGMLAVLVVLGISFAEQGRVDLMGAGNSRDLAATDGIAESGFEFAKRILVDDRHVWSASNSSWDTSQGVGWTSRWGYNPYYDANTAAGGTITPTGTGVNSNGPAPSRADPNNYLDAFQLMTWNEEAKGTNAAYAYIFKFDPLDNRTWYVQRLPPTEKELMDNWQRQPLARVRKFKVSTGTAFGMIQIAITPKDGAINVNDVFQPVTGEEYPGWYETLPAPVNINSAPGGMGLSTADPKVLRASPDRRTLEYILGRPCEWSIRQNEDSSNGSGSSTNQFTCMTTDKAIYAPMSLYPSGHASIDNGVYNFRSYFVPWGRSTVQWSLWGESYLTKLSTFGLNNITVYYNQSDQFPNRYNYEAPRYPIWAPTMPFGCRFDKGGLTGLPTLDSIAGMMCCRSSADRRWMMGGRINAQPYPYHLQSTSGVGRWDALFMGFGFDRVNPKRGGVNAAADNPYLFWADPKYNTSSISLWDDTTGAAYIGAGTYGFVRPHSFQLHFISAAAQGRFWTDLEANWYFGGAPGYGSLQAAFYPSSSSPSLSSYLYPSSAYDSMGMGTNWFPPTAALWNPGAFNNGDLHAQEVARGFTRHPGTMPASKPAATYSYPLSRFDDDIAIASPHFLFNDPRNSIRAFGIQENWGLYGNDDNDGRYYDAININVANFQVIYGLLTPEKLPSMLFRTTVAPHLHWKARMLDGAYQGMDQFVRYNPNTYAPRPYWVRDALPTDALPAPVNLVAKAPLVEHGYGAYDPTTFPAATVKLFHPYGKSDYPTPVVPKDPETIAEDPPYNLIVNPALPATPADSQYPFPLFDDTGARNGWTFEKYISPAYYKWSVHRAYMKRSGTSDLVPENTPATLATEAAADTLVILGKMDYTTPEPAIWRNVDDPDVVTAPVRNGSGLPMDDVFSDTWYDLRLAPANQATDGRDSSCATRPDQIWNWSDWFMQRVSDMPKQRTDGVFKPDAASNIVKDGGANTHREGVDGGLVLPLAASGLRKFSTTKASDNAPQPHPLYGVPNPNYLQLFPGASTNIHWSDQFRRYFPIVSAYPSNTEPGYNIPANQDPENTATGRGPTAPWEGSKLVDWFDGDITKDHGATGVDRQIHPEAPVTKVVSYNSVDPFVPAVGKDDAWRITRIGRKYQEIVADEIMDYQMNPWWPNPCVHYGTNANPQVAVPLDRTPYKSVTRTITGVSDLRGSWWSRQEHAGVAGVDMEVPDYFAYWNRFWIRSAGRYDRTQSYGNATAYNDITNPSENHGTYPQSLQYFGQVITGTIIPNRWRDRILDFPFNTLEDAAGSEWRYISGAANLMYEANVPSPMSAAPARNHPFRNWADFVGFLGHLVYRSPIINAGGSKDRVKGVEAASTLGMPATFFDGSKITDADCLKGCDSVGFEKAIVARQGWWPISGNYGEYPTPTGPKTYPDNPGGFTNPEWMRRIDEWRGRDASGLRVEQNYISERAANDVLVNLSNGRIGPIDFDGDGRITMTRKQELPGYDSTATPTNPYWPGYPWHPLTGGSVTKHLDTANGNANFTTTASLDYGIVKSTSWVNDSKSDVIQGCVTLPIKFRSNTFRVTVVVELTDAQYKNVYAVKRYARWYSRLMDAPSNGIKVHGKYSGELLQHGTRQMGQVDPEMGFLGTTKP